MAGATHLTANNPLNQEQSTQGTSALDQGFLFTEKAIHKTLELAKQDPHKEYSYLRIYLAGKICDGFTYGVQFDHKLPADLVFPLADSKIDLQKDEQTSSPYPQVICDPDSFIFVRGSSIDYVDDERGQGYLLNNPNHKNYEGKFYKKETWQHKLQQKKANHHQRKD
ncbi:MAG: iron-sulfur cluster assembly accessory protein [Proteobacteria bacterium]|nr:iron-sulfur cluster assembly accessory protein [Pseudomonadota bacterium]